MKKIYLFAAIMAASLGVEKSELENAFLAFVEDASKELNQTDYENAEIQVRP